MEELKNFEKEMRYLIRVMELSRKASHKQNAAFTHAQKYYVCFH